MPENGNRSTVKPARCLKDWSPSPYATTSRKISPDVKIVKIEKKSGGYEIGLSDGVELKFNLLGQFKSMEMDD